MKKNPQTTDTRSDITLAVSTLAAAAMANDRTLTMDAAVRQARETLAGASVSPTQIRDSVRSDKIQCLIDETWHVMLRRYIGRKYGMTPDAYRAKFGLPADYPMTAPDYARARSKIAKKTGLGKK